MAGQDHYDDDSAVSQVCICAGHMIRQLHAARRLLEDCRRDHLHWIHWSGCTMREVWVAYTNLKRWKAKTLGMMDDARLLQAAAKSRSSERCSGRNSWREQSGMRECVEARRRMLLVSQASQRRVVICICLFGRHSRLGERIVVVIHRDSCSIEASSETNSRDKHQKLFLSKIAVATKQTALACMFDISVDLVACERRMAPDDLCVPFLCLYTKHLL